MCFTRQNNFNFTDILLVIYVLFYANIFRHINSFFRSVGPLSHFLAETIVILAKAITQRLKLSGDSFRRCDVNTPPTF